MEDKLQECIICGQETAKYYQKEVTWTIKDKGQVKLKLWGTWCDSCDDGVLTHKDRERNKREFLQKGIVD